MKLRKSILTAFALGGLGGCASQLQSNDDLQAATAMQLGLQPAEVIISDRTDSTASSTYHVMTRSGRAYSCVLTATISVIGAVKSAPFCNPANAKAQMAPSAPNALQEAYREQQLRQR